MRGLQKVMDDNGEALAPVNASAARRRFDALLAQLSATLEDTAPRLQTQKSLTVEKNHLRTRVREELDPCVSAAAVLGASVPDLKAVRLPSARRPFHRFIVDCRAVLSMYEKHRAALVAEGVAPDLAATVESMLSRMEQLAVSRDLERGARVGANASLREIVANVPPVVRLLDSLAKPLLREHGKLLGQWRQVRAISTGGPHTLPATSTMKLLPASTGDASASPSQAPQRRRRRSK